MRPNDNLNNNRQSYLQQLLPVAKPGFGEVAANSGLKYLEGIHYRDRRQKNLSFRLEMARYCVDLQMLEGNPVPQQARPWSLGRLWAFVVRPICLTTETVSTAATFHREGELHRVLSVSTRWPEITHLEARLADHLKWKHYIRIHVKYTYIT